MRTNNFSNKTLLILLIVVLAALVRCVYLGHSAYRADTLEFYKYVANRVSPIQQLKNPPWVNQIPWTEVYLLTFFRITRMPVNDWTVRFPIALLGILAVYFVYRMCREAGSERMALLAAFLAAINPYAVATSREAYYYSGVICFSAFFYWRSIVLLRYLQEKESGARVWVLWLLSGILMCATHITTWSVFGMIWLMLFVLGLRRADPQSRKKLILWFVALAAVLMISIFPWLLRAFRAYVLGSLQALGVDKLPWTNFLRIVAETVPVFTFGKSVPGIVLLLLILAVGLFAAFRNRQGHTEFGKRILMMVLLAVAGNIVLCAIMGHGQSKYAYFSVSFPLVILGLAFLLVCLSDWMVLKWEIGKRYAVPVLACICAILWCAPLWAVITLEGKPTAYKTIADYINRNTEPGTLVLVDRWYEPWNELTLYPLKDGREWTFTVPCEPAQTAIQFGWRETVEDFFRKYPDSVYLPLNNSFIDSGTPMYHLGPWEWPDRFFAHKIVLKHRAADSLARWGFAHRDDFYEKNRSRIDIKLYRNSWDDAVRKAAQGDNPVVLFYGSGWRYLKPWQPISGWPQQLMQMLWFQAGWYMQNHKVISGNDQIAGFNQSQIESLMQKGRFADYRIPSDVSRLDVYNATEKPLNVELVFVAFSPESTRLLINGQILTFPVQNVAQQSVTVPLQPGENKINASAKGPLLVLDIKASVVQ
ncbi:MAG: glycosyltransferase family 39 protein [Kiritimatiellia bacterium]